MLMPRSKLLDRSHQYLCFFFPVGRFASNLFEFVVSCACLSLSLFALWHRFPHKPTHFSYVRHFPYYSLPTPSVVCLPLSKSP